MRDVDISGDPVTDCPECARLRDLVDRLTADLARYRGVTAQAERLRDGVTW